MFSRSHAFPCILKAHAHIFTFFHYCDAHGSKSDDSTYLAGIWDLFYIIIILIAGIFPGASSKGVHGSQSDDSTFLA